MLPPVGYLPAVLSILWLSSLPGTGSANYAFQERSFMKQNELSFA